ncbi:SRPBCC family protein [Jannaschia sp. Os4]|uniref:SRPBCC family protein n=1 Tax=Jannaschia sp. Os4 TaxID=2807617 RepID=UPI0019397E02|nr:SRPBCC family protein [Jannaschia sp. Os4]MBM2575735.1 SRPBCC family protein [Jannaschia sp. Os4]
MTRALAAHLAAAAAALAFAWMVSRGPHLRTGLQFVAPLGVLLLVHAAALWAGRDLAPGWAGRVLGRAVGTSALMVAGLLGAHAVLPMPAHAGTAAEEAAALVFFVIVCGTMIAVVVGLAALVLWLLYKGAAAAVRAARGGGDDARDGATFALVLLVVAGASLEGFGGFVLDGAGRAAAARTVAAPPEAVWAAMGTATAPAVPRPAVLSPFPQPVAVPVDEGVDLGSRRHVRFTGREGTGLLRMRVTRRDAARAVLTVERDGSPLAGWIGLRAITYAVEPVAGGTRLSVALDYERRLAPAWAFGPIMRGAGWLAMDVLARDVAARS